MANENKKESNRQKDDEVPLHVPLSTAIDVGHLSGGETQNKPVPATSKTGGKK